MKKTIIIISTLFVIILLTVSCKNQDSKPQLDISENYSPTPTATPLTDVEELNPIDSLENIEINGLIKVSYEENLPDDVTVIYNDENMTLLRYVSGFSDSTRVKRKIFTGYGVHNGKIVYQDYMESEANYKFGFMNSDFSLLTEAIYDRVYPFENGNAVVKTIDGWGVINIDGEVVIPCEHNQMPEVFENIIKILGEETEDTITYEVYDGTSGELQYLVKRTYIESDDSYRFYKKEADGSEEEITDLTFFKEEELRLYQDPTTSKWGYKDDLGNIVIEPEFTEAEEFRGDYASVKKDNSYGIINRDGGIVIPFDFVMAKNYGEGVAAVIAHGETDWQYVTVEGEPIFDGAFSQAGAFSYGLAPVMGIMNFENIALSQNYYYIDTLGNPVFGTLLFQKASEINDEGYGIAMNLIAQTNDNGITTSISTAYEYYIIVIRN